jgi:pSer/pThr/pTyr-binding forkhead associated (FHA) protein
MTATYSVVDPADTLVMSFADRLKHSMADHPLAGSVFFIRHIEAAPSLFIGRNSSCDLVIPESSVSGRHCEIVVDSKGNLVGADLGSTNGMSINLKRLAPGMPLIIKDGDILTFGRYSFQYFLAESLYDALQVVYG